VLESYRAVFRNAELNAELAQRKLEMPVLAIGAPEFFAPNVEQQMRTVAQSVERAEVWQHSVSKLVRLSLRIAYPQRVKA